MIPLWQLREPLEAIEEELAEVRRRLDRIWRVIETTDLDVSDATSRIMEHREHQNRLEIAGEEARAAHWLRATGGFWTAR